jgi:hypothetical protein
MLQLLLASALLAACGAAVEDAFFVANYQSCMASTKKPTTLANPPRALEFCYWYNDGSCCTPGNDALAKEKFFGLIEVGPGCSPSDHHVRATNRELREFMCMGCYPMEPKYRFLTAIGDAHLPGGQTGGDATAPVDDFTWRVCASFLYGKDDKSGFWGKGGEKYDKCGINLRTPCVDHPQLGFNVTSNSFVSSGVSVLPPDLDCGDDMVFPSSEYGTGRPAARQMLSALPQWIPNFKYVVTDDIANSSFRYNETPCFRGSGAEHVSLATVVAVTIALIATSLF